MSEQVRPDPREDPEARREYWNAQIEAAQSMTEYEIGGVRCSRIPYGQESSEAKFADGPCHDCAVVVGQLHVSGCDAERCPKCGGQAIACPCEYFPGDSEQAKRAVWEFRLDPTPEHARRLGFRV